MEEEAEKGWLDFHPFDEKKSMVTLKIYHAFMKEGARTGLDVDSIRVWSDILAAHAGVSDFSRKTEESGNIWISSEFNFYFYEFFKIVSGKEDLTEIVADCFSSFEYFSLWKIPATFLPVVFRRGHLHSFMPGTGLGLALAKEIAVLHGGSLECQSREGLGSTFTLRLPVISEIELTGGQDRRARVFAAARTVSTGEIQIEPTEHEMRENYGRKPRALVVEDQPDMSSYLASGLQRDFEVCVVSSGLSALDALEHGGSPSVILSDLMMPGMDGITLLERLKNDDRFNGIPFIMLTAWNEPEMRDRALDAGAGAFLQKPFTIANLR